MGKAIKVDFQAGEIVVVIVVSGAERWQTAFWPSKKKAKACCVRI